MTRQVAGKLKGLPGGSGGLFCFYRFRFAFSFCITVSNLIILFQIRNKKIKFETAKTFVRSETKRKRLIFKRFLFGGGGGIRTH